MKKPLLSDFGLTEDDIDELENERMDCREEANAEVKRKSHVASALIWIGCIFVLISLVLSLVGTFGEQTIRLGWMYTNYGIGMVFVIASIVVLNRKKTSPHTNEDEHINQGLEASYNKYHEAVRLYERNSRTIFKYLRGHLDRQSAVEMLGYVFEMEGYSVLPSFGNDDDFADIYLEKGEVFAAVRYRDNPRGANEIDLDGFITAAAEHGNINSLRYVCSVDMNVSAPYMEEIAEKKGLSIEIWDFDNIYRHTLDSGVYNEDKETLEMAHAKNSGTEHDRSLRSGNAGDVSLLAIRGNG